MGYVIDPPAIATLGVAGSEDRFPVGRIFCVGRNYAAHAREMGGDERDPPFFFMKPAAAVVDAAHAVAIGYPPMTNNLHHEIELVVALGGGGSNLTEAQALQAVFGYAVGLDMTRRDLQFAARDKGRPWEFGKAFAASAPIGMLQPASRIGHPVGGMIMLEVNGQVRQTSDLSLMIWSVAESLSFLSRYEALRPGDVIMNGTPEGVGAVVPGDVMRGRIDGVGGIEVRVE